MCWGSINQITWHGGWRPLQGGWPLDSLKEVNKRPSLRMNIVKEALLCMNILCLCVPHKSFLKIKGQILHRSKCGVLTWPMFQSLWLFGVLLKSSKYVSMDHYYGSVFSHCFPLKPCGCSGIPGGKPPNFAEFDRVVRGMLNRISTEPGSPARERAVAAEPSIWFHWNDIINVCIYIY